MQSVKSSSEKAQSSKEELLESLLEQLELKEIQKQYLRSRWFEKLVDANRQAKNTRRWYMRLHMITLIGGILLPGVIGMQVVGTENKQLQQGIAIAALVVAKVVAITAAAEHFLRYGDRWQDYQRNADSLDAEGWQFMQLAGNYQTYQTHDQAYTAFVSNIEQLIKGENLVSVEINQDQDKDFQTNINNSTNGASSSHENVDASNNVATS